MAQDGSGAPGRAGLGALFDAQAVAVLGASDDPSKFSGRPYQLLRQGGFAGRVYAVNPTRATVQGDRAWPDLASLPEVPDLVVIGVPAARLADAVRDCAAAGVKAAVIFAGGLAETGEEGRALEAGIAAIARAAGMRLLGPNCMGAMNLRARLYATFSNTAEDPAPELGDGGIGVVSQSGALGNFMLTRAFDAGIPVEKWITTGNEADIEFAEALDALLDDPRLRGVVGYLEGARDGPRLRAALERAQAARVPVALIKVGATEEGGRAVRSHTDALVGDDAVYEALFRRTGLRRAHTVEDLLELGRVFSTGARSRGRSLLLASISGGVGVIMAEAAVRAGLILPPISAPCAAALRARLPFLSPSNPLDVTGQGGSDFSLLRDALEMGVEDTGADMVICFLGRVARHEETVTAYLDLLDAMQAERPDVLFLTAGMFTPEQERRFRARGRLAFADPSRAVACAETLAALNESFARAAEPAPAPDLSALRLPRPAGTPDEAACHAMLSVAGVPVPDHCIAKDAAGADAAARAFDGPVALKILSPDLPHKSDMGGVRLNVAPGDAAEAFAAMLADVSRLAPPATLRGALVMPMATGFEELVIGARIDPQLGPVVMAGLGGVFVEVLGDVAVREAPVSEASALEMLRGLKGAPLLEGARGRAPRDLPAAAAAIAALSRLAAANADWLGSIEINPFALGPEGAGGQALDCAVTLADTQTEDPA